MAKFIESILRDGVINLGGIEDLSPSLIYIDNFCNLLYVLYDHFK